MSIHVNNRIYIYRGNRVYRVYLVHRVYRVYRVYLVYRVYRVYIYIGARPIIDVARRYIDVARQYIDVRATIYRRASVYILGRARQ